MKNLSILCIASMALFSSCSKQLEAPAPKIVNQDNEYIKYTINKGQQSCDKNPYTQVQYDHLKFTVKFDSSAIYQTIDPLNQKDVNKLFGFSDNNANHHQYSARFGWRWSNNALRIFAYVYNNGVLSITEMGTVAIGAEVQCSIKITAAGYQFSLDDKTCTMARLSTGTKATGYKLFPYFGGNELAPHTISIWIKELL